MTRASTELPGKGLQLLLMGAAAHEVECGEHTQAQARNDDEYEASARVPSASELEGLFRGA